MATTLSRPATAVGADTGDVVVARPQQLTVPLANSAHVCLIPAATAVMPVSAGVGATGLGVAALAVPVNSPLPFLPQQATAPVPRTAHVWAKPASRLTAGT